MIYLISDTHFYHKNIIKYENRPFSSVEEMNEKLIENWNRVVTDRDYVFHLGDFCFASDKYSGTYKEKYIATSKELLDRLNGHKVLIHGNHDLSKKICEQCGWEFVVDSYTLIIHGVEYRCVHNPKYDNNKNCIIHGHIHGSSPFCYGVKNKDTSKIYFNVSAECINYTPIKAYHGLFD